jgi:transaldolase
MTNLLESMKIFLDTADTELIRKYYGTGLIDGVTTNPTLIRKSGRDPEEVYQEIQDIGLRDISMEVVGDANEMIEEGIRLATKFPKSATIKVPCTPDGLLACAELSCKDLIRVNVTLIFDVAQAILSAKAGAAYVSPFVGRLDDNSIAGLNLIKDIDEVFRVQAIHRTKILSASIRYVNSVSQSFANGANIVTMPPSVFDKMYNHVLTDKGLEIFDEDWKNVVHHG